MHGVCIETHRQTDRQTMKRKSYHIKRIVINQQANQYIIESIFVNSTTFCIKVMNDEFTFLSFPFLFLSKLESQPYPWYVTNHQSKLRLGSWF